MNISQLACRRNAKCWHTIPMKHNMLIIFQIYLITFVCICCRSNSSNEWMPSDWKCILDSIKISYDNSFFVLSWFYACVSMHRNDKHARAQTSAVSWTIVAVEQLTEIPDMLHDAETRRWWRCVSSLGRPAHFILLICVLFVGKWDIYDVNPCAAGTLGTPRTNHVDWSRNESTKYSNS